MLSGCTKTLEDKQTYGKVEAFLVDTGEDPCAYSSTDLAKVVAWVETYCYGLNAVIWHRQVIKGQGQNKNNKLRNRYDAIEVWKNDGWAVLTKKRDLS